LSVLMIVQEAPSLIISLLGSLGHGVAWRVEGGGVVGGEKSEVNIPTNTSINTSMRIYNGRVCTVVLFGVSVNLKVHYRVVVSLLPPRE